jgi:hypothetical protein
MLRVRVKVRARARARFRVPKPSLYLNPESNPNPNRQCKGHHLLDNYTHHIHVDATHKRMQLLVKWLENGLILTLNPSL